MPLSRTIHYTLTDEAPALATYSLLPVLRAFAHGTAIHVEARDISLAARILAAFADRLPGGDSYPDTLAELGALAKRPDAVIIKLPNISASVPQLQEAIAELQQAGIPLPDYPAEPRTDDEREARRRYDKVKGSAVNPVLREGNSDRRVPSAVKAFARAHPHSMGAWSADSKTHVATMDAGDFRHNERSVTLADATSFTVEHHADDGTVTRLTGPLEGEAGEILDATFLDVQALQDFFAAQVRDAADRGVLFSLHLKATMMKVSDPILFGYGVQAYFSEVFSEHGAALKRAGFDPRNGLGALDAALQNLPENERATVRAAFDAVLAQRPGLAMVDSDHGITNLHVPSDVIIDASMPAMIRSSGKMWNAAGELEDTKAVIPDSSYAAVYEVVIEDCKRNGAFDPRTMGSVPNVGLMAQKAEEYGSHDKTFEITSAGVVRVVDAAGDTLLEHRVRKGDIWRMCRTKDAAIRNWIELAVERSRVTGAPAVFWLERERAHDAALIAKVERTLRGLETDGLDLHILSPAEATKLSVERLRRGEDTISVTGNVLRDYLTDLFPILEVGTSAKMLSVVPLMNGGGLFETGAGGSAPKHVEQFLEVNHLRWDSLGEFLALAAAFDHIAHRKDDAQARVLGATLDAASAQYLLQDRAPARAPGKGIDNRGSHYWLARYWAEALAEQTDDAALAERFSPIAAELASAEAKILEELAAGQGEPVDLGGYYRPEPSRAAAAMRPSATLNAILARACGKPDAS
jgi:isocitrate dehydrogenase